jgi:tyrosine-protein phosphatase SIW14
MPLPVRRRIRLKHAIMLAGLLAVTALAAQESWRAFSFGEEKLSLNGIDNFGRINPQLYRGAQPEPEGFAELKKLGVDIVVRLSLGDEGAAAEKEQVEALGMEFVAIPWSTMREPEREKVVTFVSLIRDNPGKTVFVHCKRGADRTGVFIAAYRIAFDRWTPTQAMAEMNAFHYHYIFLPHLQRYVEAFPSWLVSDPSL